MNIKTSITNYLIQTLELDNSPKSVKALTRKWWYSSRQKSEGGLRLTIDGFQAICLADIKYHKITLDSEINYTNQIIIWLDNFIDCPWYLDNKTIYVLTERMAIQLVLFSGNIEKFLHSKSQSLKTT